MSSLRRHALVLSGVLASLAVAISCGDAEEGKGQPQQDGGAGATNYQPPPGETCRDPDGNSAVLLRFDPPELVLAPGAKRPVELVGDPDFCQITKVEFVSSDGSVAGAPASDAFHLGRSRIPLEISGAAAGETSIVAKLTLLSGEEYTATLPVTVQAKELGACSGSGSGRVDDGKTITGTGTLAAASIGYQAGATKPNENSYLWSVEPFDASIGCAPDQVPEGFIAAGQAVSFGPIDKRLPREIPFSLPINPAAFPDGARLRHVTVSYTGPRARTPRAIPIADPAILKTASGYQLTFKAPWLGTYQAIVKSDAGTIKYKRRLAHKAIIGISMGGGGTAMHGLRNHDKFDVVVPLGGPVDWTWMIGHIERNHLGGFAPNDGTNVPTAAETPPMPTPTLPYEHSSRFNQWWYEYPRQGNGGRFTRAEYVQIFRDLALMFGNPNGYNPAPNGENLPAGVPPDDKSVTGDHPGRQCAVTVESLEGHPDEAGQAERYDNCPTERCQHPLTLHNYYDDEFNPLGTFPVITVCDGSPQNNELTPYANTWTPEDNNKPLELALAVDYNGNGVRDENEPLIRAGHEPYDDVGTDGVASVDEPGYAPGVNEDPNGDDWHPQYNPTGTENNLRFDEGEPYRDYGLDGVANTASSPYDFGEGNGKYDMAPGLRTMLERDSRTVIEQLPSATQPKKLDDAAMRRVDLWTDGGTRDLFNFAVDASSLAGAWMGRGRIVHYYTSFGLIPGQDPTKPKDFIGGFTRWSDLPGGIMIRYGKIDPTPADITNGSGQHVGTGTEIAFRLQSALYYISSRWPDAPHTLDEASTTNPAPDANDDLIKGNVDFDFTDSLGRKGPVSVNLPPGYANADLQAKRYPVIFLLHGYGQEPKDLKAALLFLSNWMNSPFDAAGQRLSKAIVVYVDGRCRAGQGGDECIRGTFFTDSVRPTGPKMEVWFNELSDEIDRRFRTMGPSEVDWTE